MTCNLRAVPHRFILLAGNWDPEIVSHRKSCGEAGLRAITTLAECRRAAQSLAADHEVMENNDVAYCGYFSNLDRLVFDTTGLRAREAISTCDSSSQSCVCKRGVLQP